MQCAEGTEANLKTCRLSRRHRASGHSWGMWHPGWLATGLSLRWEGPTATLSPQGWHARGGRELKVGQHRRWQAALTSGQHHSGFGLMSAQLSHLLLPASIFGTVLAGQIGTPSTRPWGGSHPPIVLVQRSIVSNKGPQGAKALRTTLSGRTSAAQRAAGALSPAALTCAVNQGSSRVWEPSSPPIATFADMGEPKGAQKQQLARGGSEDADAKLLQLPQQQQAARGAQSPPPPTGAPRPAEALLPGSSDEEQEQQKGQALAQPPSAEAAALTAEEAGQRKRRRDAWQREQEGKQRWDLARRLADISTDVEFLAREVDRMRGEMEVPLPPLSELSQAERQQVRAPGLPHQHNSSSSSSSRGGGGSCNCGVPPCLPP